MNARAAEIARFRREWQEANAGRRAHEVPVAEQRALFEAGNAQIALPEGCLVREPPAGIPGEWLQPRGATATQVLLYLHGGGFYFGSPLSHRHLVARLSERAGVGALSLDYRLAPEHPFPAALDDAHAAWETLLASGFAPQDIVVGGDSAGGNLAVALALMLAATRSAQPAGLYLLSPWLDLAHRGESSVRLASIDPLVDRAAVLQAAAMYLAGHAADEPLAWPLYADPAGLPPIIIQVGTDEVFLSDSLAFAHRAALAGVDVRLHVWAGMVHAWPLFHQALGDGRDAIDEAGAWIRAIAGGLPA